jgi:hypothetical protein
LVWHASARVWDGIDLKNSKKISKARRASRQREAFCFSSPLGEERGGQASSEDLLPLGYGERDRVRVRVNK